MAMTLSAKAFRIPLHTLLRRLLVANKIWLKHTTHTIFKPTGRSFGQMTREEALEKLKEPAYDPEMIKHDFEYIATKLGITVDELRGYHEAPNKTYQVRSQQAIYALGAPVMRLLGLELGVRLVAIVDYDLGNVQSFCEHLA